MENERQIDVDALQAQQAEEEALQEEELDELEAEEGLPPGRIPLPESADVPQAMRERYEQGDQCDAAACKEQGTEYRAGNQYCQYHALEFDRDQP